MEEVSEFLRTSSKLLINKQTTISEIYKEFMKFMPCYFNWLPIEIKIIIVKKVINYNKKGIVKSCARFISKSNTLLALLGRDYNCAANSLFTKHPKILLKENSDFNNYVHVFIEKFNVNNIAIYGWENKKRKALCFLDTPDVVKRFRFDNFDRLTVHKMESVVSRLRNNKKSSYKKYYTEGIVLDKFRPIHYVNKKILSEIFF